MQYITVQEAARRLSVKDETIRKWMKAGLLRGAKIGRVIRIEALSIEEMISRFYVLPEGLAEGTRPSARFAAVVEGYRHLTPRKS